MTVEDVVKELIKTADLFGTALSESRIQTYLEALDDEAPDAICVALQSIRSTAKFFPKPVEIIDAMYGEAAALAELAWEYSRTDPRDKVPDPPALCSDVAGEAWWAAIDVVGGRRMLTGEAELRQVPYLHKQFTDTFARVYRREAMTYQRERRTKALPSAARPALPQ